VAYILASVDNAASLRGIRKLPEWAYVGRVLLRRRAFGRFRICAATLDSAMQPADPA
jgi:hypothetical protein